MGTPAQPAHHHRSTTKTTQKAFKSKHSTKSAIRDAAKGKVEKDRWKKAYKSPHALVMSKFDRKNHAKQLRQLKTREHEKSTKIFAGQSGAPRIVTVVPLTRDVNARYAIEKLNDSLELSEVAAEQITWIERFKQSIQYIPVDQDLFAVLDACRVADYVVFVLSSEEEVGAEGEMLLRATENQGISNALFVVQGVEAIEPVKKRAHILQSLKSYITHFFPTQEKIYSLDSRQECSNVMRSLCTSTPKGIRWREDRSWMYVEDTEWSSGQCILTATIRGQGLNANRLLQVGDWGAFQIEKIVAAPLPLNRKRKVEEMTLDHEVQLLQEPDADQDDVAELAPEEVAMEDDMISQAPTERRGVLLDDHHYFEDDISHLPEAPRRVPKGTSKYQSAWYLGDEGDSGSDWEEELQDADMDLDSPAQPQDGIEGLIGRPEPTEAAPSEYPQSEMFLDPSPNDEAEQIEAYRTSRKQEAEDDLEFPDEIELHPNVLARERLLKFRGLKSLRTSHWNTEEDRPFQPEEWTRLLQVSDYRVAKGSATREALVGGVTPGTRVRIYLRNAPSTLQDSLASSKPLVAFSLLRHEHKRTAVNYVISLDSEHPTALRSKDELILQCGPRRMIINPLFSAQGNTPNDVHKFDRFLHPGRTAIATFIGPVTWGAVPALFFQRNSTTGSLNLIATGTCAPPSTNRVIAKRIILTGHPYKINRKLVTVRYMFFNAEDIAWFKALQLWTKRGRSGFIKESLGTHGYFKATFDGKINPQDAIGVSLYKRVWPRMAKMLTVDDVKALSQGDLPEEKMVE